MVYNCHIQLLQKVHYKLHGLYPKKDIKPDVLVEMFNFEFLSHRTFNVM